MERKTYHNHLREKMDEAGNYISKSEYKAVITLVEEIGAMLWGIIKNLKTSKMFQGSSFKFHERGFTLIEIVITMTITVIIAAIGFINIVNYKQREELDFTAQQITTLLRNAQNRSMSQESGSRWGVCFQNPVSGTDFYDLFQGTVYTSGAVVSRTILPNGIQFTIPASGASSTLIFSPVTGFPGTLTTIRISLINNSSVSSTIVINNNGEIQY